MHRRLSLPEEGSVVVVPLQAEVVPAHPHDPSGVTEVFKIPGVKFGHFDCLGWQITVLFLVAFIIQRCHLCA